MGHVIGPHIVDHVDSGFPRQQLAIAKLYRQRLIRAMQDGLSVKTYYINIIRQNIVFLEKHPNRECVPQRQVALDVCEGTRPLFSFENRPGVFEALFQTLPELRIIGISGRRAAIDDAVAVRSHDCDIYAVHARAAHQSDRRQYSAHALSSAERAPPPTRICVHSKTPGKQKRALSKKQ
jgi:hypothetical protein